MKKITKALISIIIVAVVAAALAFHFYFMSDPEIIIPTDENVILSPASGNIIKILEFNGTDGLVIKKGENGKINTNTSDVCGNRSCYIVSIFMSPFEVHIQRASLSGKVLSVEHKSGTFKITNTFESGLTNEKTEILMENEQIGKFKIIQIAGFIVRRIVTWAEPGKELAKGDRIGMIRYGSQVSIILPSENVEITAEEGEHVEAGSSIIGKIKQIA